MQIVLRVKYPDTECGDRITQVAVPKTSTKYGPHVLGGAGLADCWPQKLPCQAASFGGFFEFRTHGLPNFVSRNFEIRFELEFELDA